MGLPYPLFIPARAPGEPLACQMHSCIYLRPPSSSPNRPAPGVSVFLPNKKDDISPPGTTSAERAYLSQPKPEDGTKQAAEAQSRHVARAWRLRALPDRRRSRAHRAARLEGHLAVARQDCWRGLQHAAPQRQGALCAGRLAGRLRELDGAPARGEPELVQVIEAQVQSRYAAEAGRHARLVNGVHWSTLCARSRSSTCRW